MTDAPVRVAVLGLGAMGSRMARRLVDAGRFEVTVWNRTPAAACALGDVAVAATPGEAAAGQKIVLSVVRDDEAARAVWLGEEGALAAMASGSVAVECSTTTPDWARSLAEAGTARRVDVLDAPLAGSRPQAEAGALVFFVGGAEAALTTAQPVLDALGSAAHLVGAAGAGAQTKLLVNALFAVQVATVAELLATLEGTGLDPALAVAAAASTPVLSPAARVAAEAMLARAFAPAFPVELVVKDLGYAVADAASRGRQLPVVAAAAERYRTVLNRGFGGDNITGVARLYP